ncbi:MAG TPA: RtcB family protein, partial [Thermoplasmata archaeon]|nr:RtcB family protein [Thermoplasmata archaeon]
MARGVPTAVPLDRVDEFTYEIPRSEPEGMRVPGRLYSSAALLAAATEDPSLQQLKNVATLPGICGYAYAMPDIHFGYGFPVGGVAAFDLSEGVVSPGGIGYDINCGVRLLRTPYRVDEVVGRLRQLVDALYREVPTGVGSKGGLTLSAGEVDEVLAGGARWAVEHGHGEAADLPVQEEEGRLAGSDPSAVSDVAKKRGLRQLGTLGSGNHFLEVQAVDELFEPAFAEALGLARDRAVVML